MRLVEDNKKGPEISKLPKRRPELEIVTPTKDPTPSPGAPEHVEGDVLEIPREQLEALIKGLLEIDNKNKLPN